jgi:hypothetical protein
MVKNMCYKVSSPLRPYQKEILGLPMDTNVYGSLTSGTESKYFLTYQIGKETKKARGTIGIFCFKNQYNADVFARVMGIDTILECRCGELKRLGICLDPLDVEDGYKTLRRMKKEDREETLTTLQNVEKTRMSLQKELHGLLKHSMLAPIGTHVTDFVIPVREIAASNQRRESESHTYVCP